MVPLGLNVVVEGSFHACHGNFGMVILSMTGLVDLLLSRVFMGV